MTKFKIGDHVVYKTLQGTVIFGYISGEMGEPTYRHQPLKPPVPTIYLGTGSQRKSVSLRRGTTLALLSPEVYDLQDVD